MAAASVPMMEKASAGMREIFQSFTTSEARYFDEERFSEAEIRRSLNDSLTEKKTDAMKRILAHVSAGRDASALFPDVVKNVSFQSLELKKLIYIYLVQYAENNRELALLSINSFQKDLSDRSQLVRASALRAMSSIKVLEVIQLVMVAVRTASSDTSPYVRKTAAQCMTKVYAVDADQFFELRGLLLRLMSDHEVQVVGSAIMAFHHICVALPPRIPAEASDEPSPSAGEPRAARTAGRAARIPAGGRRQGDDKDQAKKEQGLKEVNALKQSEQEQTANYADHVKTQKDRELGPPHIWAFGGALKTYAEAKPDGGTPVLHEELFQANSEYDNCLIPKNFDFVLNCRVEQVFRKGMTKITVALGDPTFWIMLNAAIGNTPRGIMAGKESQGKACAVCVGRGNWAWNWRLESPNGRCEISGQGHFYRDSSWAQREVGKSSPPRGWFRSESELPSLPRAGGGAKPGDDLQKFLEVSGHSTGYTALALALKVQAQAAAAHPVKPKCPYARRRQMAAACAQKQIELDKAARRLLQAEQYLLEAQEKRTQGASELFDADQARKEALLAAQDKGGDAGDVPAADLTFGIDPGLFQGLDEFEGLISAGGRSRQTGSIAKATAGAKRLAAQAQVKPIPTASGSDDRLSNCGAVSRQYVALRQPNRDLEQVNSCLSHLGSRIKAAEHNDKGACFGKKTTAELAQAWYQVVSANQAQGVAALGPRDVQRLPDTGRRQLADILDRVEQAGVWPATISAIFVAAIPKGAGAELVPALQEQLIHVQHINRTAASEGHLSTIAEFERAMHVATVVNDVLQRNETELRDPGLAKRFRAQLDEADASDWSADLSTGALVNFLARYRSVLAGSNARSHRCADVGPRRRSPERGRRDKGADKGSLPQRCERAAAGVPMADKAGLVDQVKIIQRTDPESKQAWWDYCDHHLGGVKVGAAGREAQHRSAKAARTSGGACSCRFRFRFSHGGGAAGVSGSLGGAAVASGGGAKGPHGWGAGRGGGARAPGGWGGCPWSDRGSGKQRHQHLLEVGSNPSSGWDWV
ncbi:unnamed protein product [Prorocentrum cordatum]|uniref:Clathrin/coatomer adaptor adaptin-like N-terminal domain-containing protein n=1 Tax=Prorocentrum cordatum TaxID=2364126 RepID=A0ABN9RE65_9DINO|nr:unnamed protein product [Polarella glacialis]